jgi:hypothetical protein
MAIPILNELSEELKRLYIAGSPLAKGDPRLSKYIAPLKKLGEKAAVFNTLAERVDVLVNGKEEASADAVMEASLLLYSLRYTQGSTTVNGEVKAPDYASLPAATLSIPYSQLSEAIEMLSKGSKEHSQIPEELYKSGSYKDPRLFPYFSKAISDSSSVISDYTEEYIIPALGDAIIPYLEGDFEIQGSKRHGRIFRLLHRLKGKAILPLAEKAAAEGSAPVAAAAITALGEGAENEGLLLAHAKDKKAEVRGAAFAALVKLGSPKGGELLLAELSKNNIAHLESALTATGNLSILQKVFEEAETLFADYEKNHSKLAVLLRVLAGRKEEKALELLEEKVLAVMKGKMESWRIASEFDLYKVFDILAKGERKHWEICYRIASSPRDKKYFANYAMRLAAKLFSAAEFINKFEDSKNNSELYLLYGIYGVNPGEHIPDEKKVWDRRWGKVVAKHNPYMYAFVYDNDQGAWKILMESFLKLVTSNRYIREQSYQAEALSRMFANKHPDAETYYKKLAAAGYSQEQLDKYIVR